MLNALTRLRLDAPDRFLAALAVALAFMGFLTVDQMHWWQMKPDYAFGWLVPAFVAYVVFDRWPKLREIFRTAGPSPLPPGLRAAVAVAAGLVLGCGLAIFLLGAFYRAGAGVTQPGSLALAIGFSGVLLGMIYFNSPDGRLGKDRPATVWGALRADARLRAVALFLFPALIWMLSAPLVTAVENAVSLFLLHRVVAVVFTIFNLLGYPIVQEANVLVLPHGQVGVIDACSGIRSLTGCLFAGSFLGAVFLDRFWKKILLIGAAMGFAFLTNLLRSLFLTGWAYAYGSDAIEGRLHDVTGFAVLGLTVVGLFCLLPLFHTANWHRWLGLAPESGGRSNP
ncbi:MAG TPA: exosortase/archaeosortase family protein [Opitutaceae bacterium]|nr:exosortase/archaeosortase family protein [Opitutaceae bacterium]